jgi:hypothetical protein
LALARDDGAHDDPECNGDPVKGLIVALGATKQAQTGGNDTKSDSGKVAQVVDLNEKPNEINRWRLSVAPMMDWTDIKENALCRGRSCLSRAAPPLH